MNELTSKQRILNALQGKEVDRTPWSPFLAYYWDSLPEKERSVGQVEYMKKLGADPLLRGFHNLSKMEYRNCDRQMKWNNGMGYETITTKVGSITFGTKVSHKANTGFLVEHPVTTEEDFKVFQYILEHHLEIVETPESYQKAEAAYGEDALIAPSLGMRGKSAFQSLLETFCGTEALIYALYDFPEVVEECLQTMWEINKKTVRYALNSSAPVLNLFENSSTTNINPEIYQKYVAPEINEWGRMVHAEGRLLMQHTCGHLRDLVPLIAQTEVDVLESVSPPPTGNVEIETVAAGLPEHIAIIGGIEPTFFLSCTMEELEARVKHLLTAMKGRRYVLANSDSCPPGVAYEKFLLVSELVRNFK